MTEVPAGPLHHNSRLDFDLLEPGRFRELKAAVRDPAFAYVIGVCESAL